MNEWHLSQMSGFLLYPFVAVYRAITGDTEGIILTFRYICIIVQTLCCAWYYYRLKRISSIGALVASILALIYIPFNITALSYNSMGIFLMGLSTVTLATIKNNPFVRIELLFSGLAFAGAVLCCPYLIVIYGLTVLGLLAYIGFVLLIKHRLDKNPSKDTDASSKPASALTDQSKDYLRGFFWFSAGAALLAIVFAVFVLSRASISDIVKALPQIMDDPEHKSYPFFPRFGRYFVNIYYSSTWSSGVLIFLGILLGAAILDKKRMAHRPVYISLAIVAVGMMLISLNIEKQFINHLMYPVNLLSVFCLLLTRDRRYSLRLFGGIVVPGMLYSICIYFTSNQGFYVISSASTVSMLGSVSMLAVLLQEIVCPLEEESDNNDTRLRTGNDGQCQPHEESDNNDTMSLTGSDGQCQPQEESVNNDTMSLTGSDGQCQPQVESVNNDTMSHTDSDGQCQPQEGSSDKHLAHLIWRLLPAFLSIILMLTLCSLLIYRRATHVFWETSMDDQTQLIDYGPEAGVITTKYKENMYDRLMDIATYIDEKTGAESVLFLSEHTWMYLACPKLNNSAFSAWLSGINNDSISRLMTYYRLNPSKLPDVIFADRNEEGYGDILAKRLYYEGKMYLPRGGCIYSKLSMEIPST